MEVLKVVYRIIGPASRVLQGESVDLAIASTLLDDCRTKFHDLRRNPNEAWERISKSSISFASQHGIPTEFPDERRRAHKKMHGEKSKDERLTGQDQFKVDTFFVTLDEVNQQMTSRFDSDGLSFMRQLSFFMPSSLLSSYHVSTDDIQSICAQYEADAEKVVNELADFKVLYSLCTKPGSEDTVSDNNGVDEDTQIAAESG